MEKITTYDVDDDEDKPNFNLVQMTKQRRHAEEARIKKNLEDIKVSQIDDLFNTQ